MPGPTRILTAAVLLGGGWLTGQWVRGLVSLVRDNASRLGFEMLGIQVLLVTVAVSIAWVLPGRPRDRLGLGPSALPWGPVVALAVATLGLSHAVHGLLELFTTAEGSVMVGISRGTSQALGWGFVIALLGSGLAPSIGEELLCRGLLQRTLAPRAGAALAIVVSSLFFGWLHQEILHGIVATTLGLYLGVAAWASDSTRPAIAGHALNNVAALLASKGILVMRMPFVVAIGLGLGMAVGALWWATRARRAMSPPGGSDSDGDGRDGPSGTPATATP